MQAQVRKSGNTIWFRRWTGKNYAVFASLGKHICISVLAVSYSLISLQSFSQQDKSQAGDIAADTLPEVEINPDESLLAFPVQAIQSIMPPVGFSSLSKPEAAELLPGVDIRQRGNQGIQGDIQYRGGSPEQCAILLNGIPMNDAQTGHHNLNLPVPDICIDRLSVYSAGENILTLPGAYNGVISYTTRQHTGNRIEIRLSGGSFKMRKAEAMANLSMGNTHSTLAYSTEQGAGYRFNTDFNAEKLYYRFGLITKKDYNFQFQSGIMNKRFGAQGFYSNRFPSQFESIKTGFTSASLKTNGKISLQPMLYWKRNHDRFELFRESLYTRQGNYYIWDGDTAAYAPGVYYPGHNYHLSDKLGASLQIEGSMRLGSWKAGISHSYDHILSSVLGENLENPVKDRFEDSVYFGKAANQNLSHAFAGFGTNNIKGFRIQAMANVILHGGVLIPGGGGSISYMQAERYRIWLGVNRSYRLPTFTELYYHSATSTGNSQLQAETALNGELGFTLKYKSFEMQNRIFIISGHNTIDWVRQPDETVYTAMNHISLLSLGNTLSAMLTPVPGTKVARYLKMAAITYTYIHKEKYDRGAISAYSLDYLRHKITARLDTPFSTHFGANFSFTYTVRNGTYTLNNVEQAYPSWSNVDVALYYQSQRLSIHCAIQNIFAAEQVDFGGIALPGRWFTAGISVNTGGRQK